MNEKTNFEELKFLYGNQLFTLKELEANPEFSRLKEPVLIAGNSALFGKVVHVFEDNVMLRAWASETQYKEQVNQVLDNMDKARAEESGDLDFARKKFNKKAKEIVREYEALSKRTGLPTDSYELQRLATVDAPLVEGPIFDPTFLFSDRDFRGSLLPLWSGCWLPDFTWHSMNDRISSAVVFGGVAFFEHTWWRGRSLWFFTTGWDLRDLSIFGFNDTMSSAIHL